MASYQHSYCVDWRLKTVVYSFVFPNIPTSPINGICLRVVAQTSITKWPDSIKNLGER